MTLFPEYLTYPIWRSRKKKCLGSSMKGFHLVSGTSPIISVWCQKFSSLALKIIKIFSLYRFPMLDLEFYTPRISFNSWVKVAYFTLRLKIFFHLAWQLFQIKLSRKSCLSEHWFSIFVLEFYMWKMGLI